jgi:growth arrest and DNA-damage-inducible protein
MVIGTRLENEIDQMGRLVKKALQQAKSEKRLVVGLNEIGRFLAQDQSDVPIICFMVPPKTGDHATHMHEVLLKAYCLENDIYIMQLDSADKLNRIVESPRLESCALICTNPSGDSDCEGSFLDQDYQMTRTENRLVDFCEDHWNDS